MLGRPLHLDMNNPPAPPEFIVEPILERGAVTLFAGDSGAGKSIVCADWATSILLGKSWLGHAVKRGKVLVIDNENAARLVDRRLRMLGMTNEALKSLLYFSRLGVQLGSGTWLEQTLGEIEEFKPDLIVLDTASSTTTAIANDGDSVARLYATVLRPLAGFDRAVLVQHHERKPQYGAPRDSRNAVLGSVHWRTQSDTMLSIERKGEVVQHGRIKKFDILLTMPKNRDGETLYMPLAICSEHEGKRTVRGWIENREVATET
jgi:RecA-family ATPase